MLRTEILQLLIKIIIKWIELQYREKLKIL